LKGRDAFHEHYRRGGVPYGDWLNIIQAQRIKDTAEARGGNRNDDNGGDRGATKAMMESNQ
jgi:hypothetical protein